MSYGLSLWAVPRNHVEIRERYNMKHIPHITLETNLTKPSFSCDVGNVVQAEFTRGMTKFPWIYTPDGPLEASGYYCIMKGLYNVPKHRLHMSIFYNYDGQYMQYLEPPPVCLCDVVRADTRSEDPSEWIVTNSFRDIQ